MNKEEIKEKIEIELKKHEKLVRNKNAIRAFLGLLPPLDALEKVLVGVQDTIEVKRQTLTLNMILDLIMGIDEKLSGKEPSVDLGLKILIENAMSAGSITGLEGNTSDENMKKIFEKPLDIEIKNAQAQGDITGVKLNVDGEMPVRGKTKIKTDVGTIEINPQFGEITFGKDIPKDEPKN